jgi:hypothetical protein
MITSDLKEGANTGPDLLEAMTQMVQNLKKQKMPLYPEFPVRKDVLELLKTQKEYREVDGKMLYDIPYFTTVELILFEGLTVETL